MVLRGIVRSRSRLVTEIYPKFLVSSSYRNAEILIHRKDGSLATVMLSMTAYRGDKGRLERSVCILEDVTEKKIAQIKTNRGDQRFRGAFDAAAHGMAGLAAVLSHLVREPNVANACPRPGRAGWQCKPQSFPHSGF